MACIEACSLSTVRAEHNLQGDNMALLRADGACGHSARPAGADKLAHSRQLSLHRDNGLSLCASDHAHA